MSLQVEVDLASSVPPYEQIRVQVMAHISARQLGAGDRLPTIRALASDLGVAAGTVARAYRELESAAVVTSRRRTGTVVAPGATPADSTLQQFAADLVIAARNQGMADEVVLDLMRGALLTRGQPQLSTCPCNVVRSRGIVRFWASKPT